MGISVDESVLDDLALVRTPKGPPIALPWRPHQTMATVLS